MSTTAPSRTASTAPPPPKLLKLPSLVLFGVAYMAPAVVLATFGVIAVASNGTTTSAYLLATAAMLLTALSYGKLSRIFPVTGSAYTYVRRVLDSRVGFMVGWILLLDYLFLPMVIWLIGASFLSATFPVVPFWAWIVIQAVIVSVINIFGIRVADRLTYLLMAFVLLVLVAFVALSFAHVGSSGEPVNVFAPLWNSATTFGAVSAGAAIAAYSFLGFDAITTLTEESERPSVNVPRAIILTTLIAGVIFMVVGYAAQLVQPGAEFANIDSAAFEIAQSVGGDVLSSLVVAALVIGGVASAIAAQTGLSRLLYGMGRDGVLPRRVFGYLHPRLKTPVWNIVISGAVGLIATQMTLATSTSFINFGAFTAFTLVNISVIVYSVRQRRTRAKTSVVTGIVLPALATAVTIYLLFNLDSHALILGCCWLAIGIVYLAFLTKGFKNQPPELSVLDRAEA